MVPAAACRKNRVCGCRRNVINPALGRDHASTPALEATGRARSVPRWPGQNARPTLPRPTPFAVSQPGAGVLSLWQATAARRTGSQVRLTPSEPVCLALFSLRMGAGGGAQSCACGGCRWVTHPHRSLLHQFWWGKAPLIGFVENDLPPWRSGRNAAHGLTGGTVSWRVPFAGKARSGRLPPQPSLRKALQDTVPPSRPPLEESASRLSTGSGGTMLAAVGKPCPQRPAPCRRFLLAAVAALPIDAATMRFGSG